MPICLFKVSEIFCSYDFAHIICTNFLYYGSKDWVPADVIAKCKVTLEFCCAEKQPGNSSSINEGRMPYMWCGQLRRTIDISDKNEDQDKSHLARMSSSKVVCLLYRSVPKSLLRMHLQVLKSRGGPRMPRLYELRSLSNR